jgi:cell division protease FtsH
MVTQADFEDAKDKVLMGSERRSMVMSDDEKRNTAYHEGGHALVALAVPHADPVHKATIIPRGRALGMVMQLPEADRYSQHFTQMTSKLAIMMAGRVAEELILGKDQITSGASSDINAATNLARSMVTKWGFSDKLGTVAYGGGDNLFGYQQSGGEAVSEATAQVIDDEVRRLVKAGEDEARRILTERMDDLHKLAKALLEYETLSGDEIVDVMKGIPPVRDKPEDKGSKGPSVSVPITGSEPELA